LKAELEKSSLSAEDKKDKQQALRKEQLQALRAILTPDQQKKFDDYIASETKKLRTEKKKNKQD
jgi:Spy/CpxP family protein refolding chaperone